MPPQNNITTEISPDQAAAALAYATHLSEKVFGFNSQPQQDGETPETPETPPQPPETAPEPTKEPEPVVDTTTQNNEAITKEFDNKLDEFRKEIKDEIKKEMEGIRKSIKDALRES